MLICSIDVFVCLFSLELKGPLNADFLICSCPYSKEFFMLFYVLGLTWKVFLELVLFSLAFVYRISPMATQFDIASFKLLVNFI